MMKASISQVVFPRLALFRDEFYNGRRFIVRGNVGIRNLERTFGDIESLRFFSTSSNATLVLFSEPNFRAPSGYSEAIPTLPILMILFAAKSRNPLSAPTVV